MCQGGMSICNLHLYKRSILLGGIRLLDITGEIRGLCNRQAFKPGSIIVASKHCCYRICGPFGDGGPTHPIVGMKYVPMRGGE